jgi:hypothetical protein
MVKFTKLDYPVWLLLEISHCIGSDLGLLALGLVLLLYNLLWTFLCVVLLFVIGRSPSPRLYLILIAPDRSAEDTASGIIGAHKTPISCANMSSKCMK